MATKPGRTWDGKREYESEMHMWKDIGVLNDRGEWNEGGKQQWYMGAAAYWRNQEVSNDGVLGGYGNISMLDVGESVGFLMDAFPNLDWRQGRAVDCGAGIGRTAELLLAPRFQSVDLVEPCKAYADYANQNARTRVAAAGRGRLDRVIQEPLQNFCPEPNSYDLIWVQWVIGYLTDDDFVRFLSRCKSALTKTGVIVIKDNIARNHFLLDPEDRSVTRGLSYLQRLLGEAGLSVQRSRVSRNLPEELLPVHMIALK